MPFSEVCMCLCEGVYLLDRAIQLNVSVALKEEERSEEEGSCCVFKAAHFVS